MEGCSGFSTHCPTGAGQYPVFEFGTGCRIKSGMTSTTRFFALRLRSCFDSAQHDLGGAQHDVRGTQDEVVRAKREKVIYHRVAPEGHLWVPS